MFTKDQIKKVVGEEIALTTDLSTRIELWRSMYNGKAYWVNDCDGSLRLEHAIAREFADVVLNEAEATVSNVKLNDFYKAAVRDLNENLQEGLALGAFCVKPLGVAGQVEYIMQGDFYPIRYDSAGRLMDVLFVELRRQGDTEFYRRFERHTVTDTGLVITNQAFKGTNDSDIGKMVPLDTFEDWGKLSPEIKYPLMTKPDFGYYRNPIKNVIDRSFNGVSIYETAVELIKKADKQFGRLDWEYESAERSIIADVDAIPTKNSPGYNTLPKERLIKTLDGGDGTGTTPYHEFSPELRGDGFIAGLNEYKRAIEEVVGLAYGDLSNVQDVDKTATEVRASKKRKYNRVIAIQSNLKDCLSDLVDALAFYNGLATTGYKYTCEFHDSILIDEEADKASDKADVAAGLMNPWEYRVKYYGEDEETAKANVPNSPDVMGDSGALGMSKSKTPAPSTETATTEVQGKALNGAQTQSLIAIMGQFSSKSISEGQAINLIAAAIGITKEEARKILNGEA